MQTRRLRSCLHRIVLFSFLFQQSFVSMAWAGKDEEDVSKRTAVVQRLRHQKTLETRSSRHAEEVHFNQQRKTVDLVFDDGSVHNISADLRPLIPWDLSEKKLHKYITAHHWFLKEIQPEVFKLASLLPLLGGGNTGSSGGGGGSGFSGGRDNFYSGGGITWKNDGSTSYGGGGSRSSHKDGWNCDKNGKNCHLTITVHPGGEEKSSFDNKGGSGKGNSGGSGEYGGGTKTSSTLKGQERQRQIARQKEAEERKTKIIKDAGIYFYEEFEKAIKIRDLINTKSWDDVYKYSDAVGFPRELVNGVIYKNRLPSSAVTFEKYMHEANPFYSNFESAIKVKDLINTKSWDDVYKYSDSVGLPREFVHGFIEPNRFPSSPLTFEKYMHEVNPFYSNFEKAIKVKDLINTKSWDDVYKYSDSVGFPREFVHGVVYKNRFPSSALTFEKYMREVNPFYSSFETAIKVKDLINTKPWKDVYKYSDEQGMPRELIAFIGQYRTTSLPFGTYMKESNPFYVVFEKASLTKISTSQDWAPVQESILGLTTQQPSLMPLSHFLNALKAPYERVNMSPEQDKEAMQNIGWTYLEALQATNEWHISGIPASVWLVISLDTSEKAMIALMGAVEGWATDRKDLPLTRQFLADYRQSSETVCLGVSAAINTLDLDEEDKITYSATAAAGMVLASKGRSLKASKSQVGQIVKGLSEANVAIKSAKAHSQFVKEFAKNNSSFLTELEKKSFGSVPKVQQGHLLSFTRDTKIVKMEKEAYDAHRKLYDKPLRDSIKRDWEKNTGQKWPQYGKWNERKQEWQKVDVDLHHIIPQRYGGPHEWWNAHPIHPANHTGKGGIHSDLNSILNKILKEGD